MVFFFSERLMCITKIQDDGEQRRWQKHKTRWTRVEVTAQTSSHKTTAQKTTRWRNTKHDELRRQNTRHDEDSWSTHTSFSEIDICIHVCLHVKRYTMSFVHLIVCAWPCTDSVLCTDSECTGSDAPTLAIPTLLYMFNKSQLYTYCLPPQA